MLARKLLRPHSRPNPKRRNSMTSIMVDFVLAILSIGVLSFAVGVVLDKLPRDCELATHRPTGNADSTTLGDEGA